MPKFSVITTVYKHEKFISETIESMLSQTSHDWELLIGDDSPDDRAWNIIESYVEKYPDKIRAWHHIPNKWLVENMNFLLSQVSPDSEYIAFLEGDDRFTSDCLEKKWDIFSRFPGVWVVYSDMDFINAESKVTLTSLLGSQGVRFYQDVMIPTREYILARNPLMVSYSSIAIRKDVLERFLPIKNPTGSKMYAVSDYDLIFRIIQDNKVYWIEKSLIQYRRHQNNLSASYGWLFDDLSLLMENYKDTHKISMDIYKEKISWIYILKSISYLWLWNKKDAWNLIRKSIQEDTFAFFFYKIIICILLIPPISWTQKIIQKKLRRGS